MLHIFRNPFRRGDINSLEEIVQLPVIELNWPGLKWPAICLAAGLALAACEPTTQATGTACQNQRACEAAAFAANASKANIGVDFGDGVILTSVQAIGSTLVEDFRVPETAAELGLNLSPQIDAAFANFINDLMVLTICTPDPAGFSAEPFFATGARYRARFISRDGEVVADTKIDSCP
jgi:hypothetical protein